MGRVAEPEVVPAGRAVLHDAEGLEVRSAARRTFGMSRSAGCIMRRIDGFSLWIGSARDARDIKGVLDAEIEVIVDLAMMCEPVTPTRELVYLRFPLVDGSGNPPWLIRAAIQAVDGLIRDRVPTLVACDGGMSRSLAISAAALAKQVSGEMPDEMLRRVSGNGPADVHPVLWADVNRQAMGD
jgi:hypothetical protein